LIIKFEVDVGRLAFVVGVRMWWELDEVRHVGEVAGLGRDGVGEGAHGGLPFSISCWQARGESVRLLRLAFGESLLVRHARRTGLGEPLLHFFYQATAVSARSRRVLSIIREKFDNNVFVWRIQLASKRQRDK
jgi:hypothetical protein